MLTYNPEEKFYALLGSRLSSHRNNCRGPWLRWNNGSSSGYCQDTVLYLYRSVHHWLGAGSKSRLITLASNRKGPLPQPQRAFVFISTHYLDFFFDAPEALELRLELGGTLPPSLRASDNPIAIACLGFRTFL